MSVTNTPIFPQSLIGTGVSIYHPTGTMILAYGTNTLGTGTITTIFTPGTNGAVITAISVANMDTATCTMVLLLTTGTVLQVLGQAAIAGGGTTTSYVVPVTNLLNGTQGVQNLPFDSCGNKILYVAAGNTLAVGLLTTLISTGAPLAFNIYGGNF
jgi:hypothetical protein